MSENRPVEVTRRRINKEARLRLCSDCWQRVAETLHSTVVACIQEHYLPGPVTDEQNAYIEIRDQGEAWFSEAFGDGVGHLAVSPECNGYGVAR